MKKIIHAVVVALALVSAGGALAAKPINHKPAIAKVATAYMRAELSGGRIEKRVVVPGSIKVVSGYAVAYVHPVGSERYVKLLLAYAGREGWYGLRYRDFWTMGCNVPARVQNALGLRCNLNP